MKKNVSNFVECAIIVIAWIVMMCVFSPAAQAAEPVLQGKTIVVENTNKAGNTGYTIKVDGKLYAIMRGPRGGLYYMKDGKKVYLTAKQKALIK